MHTIGIRDLANRASAVIGDIERTQDPVIVTRHGRPVAVVSAIDEDALYDFILATAPEYAQNMRDAEAAAERGERNGIPLDQVIAELEAEEQGTASA